MNRDRELFNVMAEAIIINGVVQGDWDYPHADNDDDLNGNNGLDYVGEEAQELGFDNNFEYFISILPYKKPKNIKQLEENWKFMCKKAYDNDAYYECHEVDFREVRIDKLDVVVLIAYAIGKLGY